jgi:hypothetical protein
MFSVLILDIMACDDLHPLYMHHFVICDSANKMGLTAFAVSVDCDQIADLHSR